MGKITSIITFTGKLGNTVGSKGLRGRHLIRARQYEVKNPRSNAQNVQRMIFATAATSLAYLTEILNNSFEGKAFGQESLSYARKVNLDLLRNMNPTSAASIGSYLKKGDKHFAPNTYILSQGTLFSPSVEIISGADYQLQIDGMTAANAQKTASQLFPNIAVGDQITYIGVADTGLDVSAGEDSEIVTDVRYCRFAFKDDTTPALIANDSQFYPNSFKLNPAAIDLVKAKGDWQKIVFESTEGYISTQDVHDGYTDKLTACAILVSNLENNKRSTTRLVVDRTRDWKWRGADAYPTYGNVAASQFDFASDIYLNNSARRAAAGGESGAATATIASENLPTILTDDNFTISGLPAMPTELRVTAYQGGELLECANIVGLSTGANVLTGSGSGQTAIRATLQSAPAMSGNECTLVLAPANNYSVVVTGGYAVCDGVRYNF